MLQIPTIAIDTYFYALSFPSLIPLNIILYNVFGSEGVGTSTLYGTESWSFYFYNGVLNFNVWFCLALLMPAALVSFQHFLTFDIRDTRIRKSSKKIFVGSKRKPQIVILTLHFVLFTIFFRSRIRFYPDTSTHFELNHPSQPRSQPQGSTSSHHLFTSTCSFSLYNHTKKNVSQHLAIHGQR